METSASLAEEPVSAQAGSAAISMTATTPTARRGLMSLVLRIGLILGPHGSIAGGPGTTAGVEDRWCRAVACSDGRPGGDRTVHRPGAGRIATVVRAGVPRDAGAGATGRSVGVRLGVGQRAPRFFRRLPAVAHGDAGGVRGRHEPHPAGHGRDPHPVPRSDPARRGCGRGRSALRRTTHARPGHRLARGGVPDVRRPDRRTGPAPGRYRRDPAARLDGRALLLRGRGALLRPGARDAAARTSRWSADPAGRLRRRRHASRRPDR